MVPDFNLCVDYRRVLKTVEQRGKQREEGVGREKGEQGEKEKEEMITLYTQLKMAWCNSI